MRSLKEILKSKKYLNGRFFGNGVKREPVIEKIKREEDTK